MGHGMCAALVPELFTVDEESSENRMGEFEVGVDRRAAVLRGVAACPEQAIALDAEAPRSESLERSADRWSQPSSTQADDKLPVPRRHGHIPRFLPCAGPERARYLLRGS